MDPEVKSYFEESLKKPTVLARIKYKIKLIKLKDSEINSMKHALIKEAKPLFSDFWLNRSDKNILDELTVKCFDKRILSLPKAKVFELYSNLNKLKNAKSKEAKEYMYVNFMTHLTLEYNSDNWFLEKAFYYARTGKI